MKQILEEIQAGDFAREWIAENRAGQENFKRMRAEQADTPGRARRQGAALAHGLDQAGVLRQAARCWPTSSGTAAADATSRLRAGAERFHRSLAHAAGGTRLGVLAAELPGSAPRAGAAGYEDWYLSRTSPRSACSRGAVGVARARRCAQRVGAGTAGSLSRPIAGARPREASLAVWSPTPGCRRRALGAWAARAARPASWRRRP